MIHILLCYIIIYIFRLHHNNNSSISEKFWRITIIIVSIIIAILITYSRVYLLYHSNSQVIWGTFIGIMLGIIWFIITYMILTPIFPIIVSW